MKVTKTIHRSLTAVAVAATVKISMLTTAVADLPTPVTPTTAPAAGNFIDWMKWWFRDSIAALTLIAMAIIFAIVGYLIFQKLVEVRRGRAEMSELFVHGGAAAGVAVVAAYFLNQSVGVIAAPTTP